ncbi:MAG: hypothetical protein IJU93_06270 [Lachnospiraceae bacterium]|nr:hypothetical protein [Lachnospiraceae bacterium]
MVLDSEAKLNTIVNYGYRSTVITVSGIGEEIDEKGEYDHYDEYVDNEDVYVSGLFNTRLLLEGKNNEEYPGKIIVGWDSGIAVKENITDRHHSDRGASYSSDDSRTLEFDENSEEKYQRKTSTILFLVDYPGTNIETIKETIKEDPIIQNVITPAKSEPGEDKTDINPGIIIGSIGGIAVAGGMAGKKKKKEDGDGDEEEEDPVTFRMVIYKDFGDTLYPGEEKVVYARIEQYKPIQEATSFRNDLTAQIQCYAVDEAMNVSDGGIVTNGCDYRAAVIKVPEGSTATEAAVGFTLTGPGGVYNRVVVFKVANPMIVFGQDNLGLPANGLKNAIRKDKSAEALSGKTGDGVYELPFIVMGMPAKGTKITLKLDIRACMNSEGRFIEGSINPSRKIPYSVNAVPDPKPEDAAKNIWNVVIKETMDYELPAGTTEGFELIVTAENGTPGAEGYLKAERVFAIYRIHMGLVLTVEGKSIPCYSQLKESGKRKISAQYAEDIKKAAEAKRAMEAQGDAGKDEEVISDLVEKDLSSDSGAVAASESDLGIDPDENKLSNEDIEPVYGNGTLALFMYREEDMSIVRIPVSPEDKDGKVGKEAPRVRVTVKQLANDRYCHAEEANKSHQELVDKVDVRVIPTGRVTSTGAHLIRFFSAGRMDPPTRFIVNIEVSAKYNDKVYKTDMDVLLRSQPFRVAQNSDEEAKFIREDEKIAERLLHIQEQIYAHAFGSLFSLYDMIERMLKGYDNRFGYDRNQVINVMSCWTGWIHGTFVGANAKATPVTLADDLNACYAFMQGLRDNTGILGRMAMGVMTGGYSEYVFSTMTLAEEMKEKVFACKGDKDFGFFDAVQMGVDEFGKQIILDCFIGGIGTGELSKYSIANLGTEFLASRGIDVGGFLASVGGKYRKAMDKADVWLKKKLPLYKTGDKYLQNGINFFNTSAGAAKAGLEQAANDANQAVGKGQELLQKAKKELSPAELKAAKEYEQAVEDAMKDVGALKKAQMELEACTDATKLKELKAKYRECADKVWTNKNALRELQNNSNPYAQRMRAQFNEYRETLLDEVQREALEDIAKEIGRSPDELYVMNVSNGVNTDYKIGKKVPGDRDITFKQKVLSDKVGTLDLTIDQELGQRAVARRLYKKMNGKEADSIEEALKFMKEKDVTYVNPESFARNADGTYNRYVFEHNLEGYEDLKAMVGLVPDPSGSRKMVVNKKLMKNDLHNLEINRAAVKGKGTEWFDRDAGESIRKAMELEAKAEKAVGTAKDELLKQAREFRNASYGQKIEGIRQISKQVNNIIEPRAMMRTGKSCLTQEAMEIHQMALRVGKEITPVEFEHILRVDYGMTLTGYADYMASFLDRPVQAATKSFNAKTISGIIANEVDGRRNK